ncbi:MAG: hypothetical protein QUS14_02940 [Pyrinomonadaceae bacterium]|nr:hypothetical protein [Pyrinomonadaceae bacterium]
MTKVSKNSSRVAIIGPENVSASDVYSLLVGGFVSELVLLGKGARNLMHEIEKLQRFVAFPHSTRTWAGTYEDTAQATVAIIAFGSRIANSRKADKSLVRGASMRLKDAGFNGVLLVARDPADLLAESAFESAGLPRSKVIGLGHVKHHRGEDRMTWCTAIGEDVTFMDNCNADCAYFEQVLRSPGVIKAKESKLKSYSPENIAACVTQVCEAVITNSHTVIPVFTNTADERFTVRPCSLGRSGVEEVLNAGNQNPNHVKPITIGIAADKQASV